MGRGYGRLGGVSDELEGLWTMGRVTDDGEMLLVMEKYYCQLSGVTDDVTDQRERLPMKADNDEWLLPMWRDN